MNTFEEPDAETGEIFPLIHPPKQTPVTGSELHIAMHSIMSDLPVWITQDESATIEFKSGSKMKTKYATLKAIMIVVRPIALKHGVRIRQGCDHAWQLDTGQIKGRMVPVFTDMIHTATGQFERTTVEIPMSKIDAMSMGSAISFGRRYGLLAALGLTTDEADDDGRATQKKAITDEAEESQKLYIIKSEISGCKTIEELNQWADKAEKAGRLGMLEDHEMSLAQAAFSTKLKSFKDEQMAKPEKK